MVRSFGSSKHIAISFPVINITDSSKEILRSVVVLIVLCFDVTVELLFCLHLMHVFIYIDKSMLLSGHLFGNSCSLSLRYVLRALVAPLPDHRLLLYLFRGRSWPILKYENLNIVDFLLQISRCKPHTTSQLAGMICCRERFNNCAIINGK